MRREIYRVAEHYFSLTMSSDNPIWSGLQQFDPFVTTLPESESCMFALEVVDSIPHCPTGVIVEGDPERNDGMVDIKISSCEGGYLLNIMQPYNNITNASQFISSDGTQSQVVLQGDLAYQLQALNNTLIISYMIGGAKRHTILLHASTVIHDDGLSYVFLGKSGTGKSTHSRMWLAAFPNSTLLNDDHPIVRIGDDGQIRTYGSPWSGKCPCYKNMSAPLGGIVRIEQAPINEPIVLRPIMAYASIISSSSSLQWLPEANEAKIAVLNEIASRIPNLRMRCLPNVEAAHKCKEALDAIKK